MNSLGVVMLFVGLVVLWRFLICNCFQGESWDVWILYFYCLFEHCFIGLKDMEKVHETLLLVMILS